MGGVTLLVAAHAAGLQPRGGGHHLVVRGPKSAEPLALVLLDRNAEVLGAPALEAARTELEAIDQRYQGMMARAEPASTAGRGRGDIYQIGLQTPAAEPRVLAEQRTAGPARATNSRAGVTVRYRRL